MTAVPVFWVSRHQDRGIIARGYYDQGLLEALLSRDLWTPPAAYRYVHHEVGEDWPDVPGAVVILPARHHGSPDDVAWFLDRLAALDWSVVILAGCEDWAEFPWEQVPESPTRRVWTMQPIPAHAHLSGLIPGGWYPGVREAAARNEVRARTRPLDWMFAGQVTHFRRKECVAALRDLPGGWLHETSGYLQGVPLQVYYDVLASAKVVPSPSGPYTVDTARPLEAMEMGCVPVVDMLTPRGTDHDYWALVFPPYLSDRLNRIIDWSDFPNLLAAIKLVWPVSSNMLFAAWQRWKREMTCQLDDDVAAVSGLSCVPSGPDDLITVIVTTSPTHLHPSTSHIEETIESIRSHLPYAQILVAADGVRPEQYHLNGAYQEYLGRLLWLANNQWHNVLPVLLGHWGHQANTVRQALTLVTTPLVLFCEHDTPLTPVDAYIDWAGICRIVQSGEANVVRFHITDEVLADHESIMLGPTEKLDDVPLRRTSAFWARPHIASTRFFREQIIDPIMPESRTMIEEPTYSRLHCDVADFGMDGWDRWRVWIYLPEGGSVLRSRHLDSRGAEDKYPMWAGQEGTIDL